MTIPGVKKLLDCAKAIEDGDLNLADSLIKDVLTENDDNLVKYFVEALVRRVYKIYPKNPKPLVPSCTDLRCNMDYQIFPFFMFAGLTTRRAIVDALTGKKRIQVIDFSLMASGKRWGSLLDDYVKQSGDAISFHLTSIGPILSNKGDYLNEILEKLPKNLPIEFEMKHVVANTPAEIVEAALKLERSSEDETIVVIWEFELHKLLAQPGATESVLSKLKELKPEIMIVVEQEATSLNGQDFLECFSKSIHYYSIVFDSLDKDNFDDGNHCKVLWEMYFRRKISNLVAQQSTDQIVRLKTFAEWQVTLFHFGFHHVRLQTRFNGIFCDQLPEYHIEEKNRHPVLYWHDDPLLFTSTWKPDPTQPNSESSGSWNQESSLRAEATIPGGSSGPPILAGTVSSSSFLDDQPEDPHVIIEGNVWSPECSSINQIAASAEIFDMMEYICHVHYLPLALTWMSDSRVLHLEKSACYLNDFTMVEFMEACGEHHLEEGKGVAGKALQLNSMYFVSDISKLDVKDYPFIFDSWEFGLHGVVAIKLASMHIGSINYVLEFFLPLEMKEISAQRLLVNEIVSILQKNSSKSWRVCNEELSRASEVEIMAEEAGTTTITPAAIPASQPPELSEIGSLSSISWLNFNPPGDDVRVPKTHDQKFEGQTSGIKEHARATDITLLKTPHRARPRKKGTASSNKLRSKVWKDFDKLKDENGAEWAVCKHCKKTYRGESTRGTQNLLKHLRKCPGEKGRKAEQETPKDQPVPFMVIETDSLEHFELIDNLFSTSLIKTLDRLESSSRKQQGNSEHQMPRHQAGPFKVIKSTSPDDLKLINYIFNSSLDESEIVVHCNRNHLTRSELCTLRPETCLDDNVISVMSDALTLAERKKKGSRNWYLPICFAEYAYDTSECISFARKHMLRENYMSALFSCEKMYVPVFDKERSHFYLYVLHNKKQVVEIWDSLAKSSGSSVDNRLRNMLATLDILFEDDIERNHLDGWSFASFSVDRPPNVPQQTNGYDCGVYVIKFMLAPEEATQPDFDFDSDTERLDVVLRLLDGNVNSCITELAAKAEAAYYVKEVQKPTTL